MTNYKESEINWIGKIPDSWGIGKIKYFASIFTGNSIKDDEKDYYTDKDNAVPYISTKDINIDDNSVNYYNGMYIKNTDLNFKRAPIDSILLCIEGGSAGKKMSYLTKEVCFVNKLCCFSTKGIDSKYLYYYLMSPSFIEEFNLNISGLIGGVSTAKINNIKAIIPSQFEQKKIADLLDKKCEQINRLIEIQQQEIEKLKEYKTSVITQAVTKGLDPNVPMKDSGDLCYNNIPAIWKFTKTLNMLSMPITDGPHTTPVLYDNGIEFISAEAVKNGKIDFGLIRGYISEDFYNECCAKYKPELHDIYMIKSGATTGNIAFVSEEDMKHRFNIWSPLAVFRCKKELHYKYLYYQMQSRPYNQQVQLYWSYGTQQNIGMRVLEKLKIVVPPLKEQIEIANYIDDSIIKIDILINSKQQKIDKLQEYKKSLIYEYVTGKRRVI